LERSCKINHPRIPLLLFKALVCGANKNSINFQKSRRVNVLRSTSERSQIFHAADVSVVSIAVI